MSKKNHIFDGLIDVLVRLVAALTFLLFVFLWFSTGNIILGIISIIFVFLVFAGIMFLLAKERKKKLLASGIDIIDSMDGILFEELVIEHFKKQGYKGKLTPAVADYGADLLLKKDDETIAVQAKRYTGKVGISAIQQIIGALKHYDASGGLVITNSYFTNNAQNLAHSNKIELWDRNDLIDLLSKNQGRSTAEKVVEELPTRGICPQCNNDLLLRNGKRGKFYGCSSFPRCRYTQSF